MNQMEARAHFAASRVAHLATADAGGRPHVVPVAFALPAADVLATAVDHKRKRTRALRRLANIAANPAVSVLADHYEDEWSRLWWVRADGRARVLETAADDPRAWAAAIAALTARYGQYRDLPPAGPVIWVEVERWSGWAASVPQ